MKRKQSKRNWTKTKNNWCLLHRRSSCMTDPSYRVASTSRHASCSFCSTVSPHQAWSFSWLSSLPGRKSWNSTEKIVVEDPDFNPRVKKALYTQSSFHSFSHFQNFMKFHHSIQTPGTPSLQLNPDPPHASDCCLKFFSWQCALVVLVILLQVVNHCLRIAPPVSENRSPGPGSEILSTVCPLCLGTKAINWLFLYQLSGLNFLEILCQFILCDTALCKGGKSAKSIQSECRRKERKKQQQYQAHSPGISPQKSLMKRWNVCWSMYFGLPRPSKCFWTWLAEVENATGDTDRWQYMNIYEQAIKEPENNALNESEDT